MAKGGANLEDLKAYTLTVRYPSQLKISFKKYSDLMEYIASLYQDCFKSLKHENEPKK